MRPLLILVVLILGGAALSVALYFWFQAVDPPAPPVADISPILEEKNLALADLENLEFLPAIDRLKSICAEVPDDSFGPKNLAIAGVMAVDALDRARDPESFQLASEAAAEGISKLQTLTPDDGLPNYLEGRRLARAGDVEGALATYIKAAHQAEDQDDSAASAYWYAAYELARDERLESGAGPLSALLISSLDRQPQNLFLLTEALPLAVKERPDVLTKLIAATRIAAAPLRDGMVKRLGTRGDPIALLDEASEAIEAGDVSKAARPLGILSRILRPDSRTKSDQRIARPNLLEFVALDFAPEFYATYEPAHRTAPAAFLFDASRSLPTDAGRGTITGIISGDVNLDGEPDLFCIQLNQETETTHAVYQSMNSTRSDAPVSDDLIEPITISGSFQYGLLVDLDNDFRTSPSAVNKEAGNAPCRTTDLDLLVWGESGLCVLRNELGEDGPSFKLIEDETLAEIDAVSHVATFDAEADGDLDLLVASEAGVSLLLNRGDAMFELSDEPVDGGDAVGPLVQMIPVDLDRDVDVDVVVLRAADPAIAYFENLRHGRMRLHMIDRALGPGAKPAGLAVLDADENGSWDLLVTTQTGGKLLRSMTPAPGRWSVTDMVDVSVSGPFMSEDFDNDGRIDVAQSDGTVAAGLGVAPWFEVAAGTGLGEAVAVGDIVDFNNDGRLDLVIAQDADVVMAANLTDPVGNHLQLTLLAEQIAGDQSEASGRVNAYGLGTTVAVRSGARLVSTVIDGQVTHVGLGDANKADSIRLVWTNGIPGHVIEPASNSYVCEKQTLKGSCPYLYSWDGEEFVFVTDLLWAAPIGLQFADGVQAVPREWEYLFVSGDQVQPKDGRYELRITEELWEAAYFDEVELIAVDHPIGTELVTNEKVGPPSIAEHRLFVFDESVAPLSVAAQYEDGTSRDLTDLASAVDGQFAKPHRVKRRQGLVEQHAIEIAFPAVDNAEQPMTLLLTGWVRPTDTSINVALSHDPRLDGPIPPRLLVPDGDGSWRVAREFMGFPGGKTKTIAVDVTGLLDQSDPRLRIETSMEFSWDRVALVVGPADKPANERACVLRSAELRSRGFSARLPEIHGGPETYDYATVTTEPQWPLMEGRFTRLGDVTDLLASSDDRLVVMGSGDEMVLSFDALPAPPDGWRRDFVLKSVGWDKDADLNTIYGDTSEPYPTLGVANYPEFHDFESRDDAAFQTRRFVAE